MNEGSKYYFPQLDAIRGLSFLAVYFYHAFHPQFGIGFFSRMLDFLYGNLALSIDVFFILSSFLLTWLGLNEYKIKGNFSSINYFIRRILRIWPLYYLIMIFSFVLLPYASAKMNIPITLPPAYHYLFFISNFYLEGHVYFLKFLWTLSVEEQFYLLWGFCLLFFQKRIAACAFLFIGISVAFTIYAIFKKEQHNFSTLLYLFDFAVGILAAVILQSDNRITTFFKKLTKSKSLLFMGILPVFFILLFCAIDVLPQNFSAWLAESGRYFFIIYTGFFIIEQMVNQNTILKLKAQKWLVYTGKISYGLYCFHGIVLTFGLVFLEKLNLSVPVLARAFLFLIVNYVIAAISYRFIEKPFLLLKDKMRRI